MSSRSVSRGTWIVAVLGAALLAAAPADAADPVGKPAIADPGAVQGKLAGTPFEVRSALSGKVWGQGGGVAVVVLSDQPETCDHRREKKQKRGARRIHLVLSFKEGASTSPPMGVGEFVIHDYKQVEYSDAFIVWHDGDCRETRRVTVKKGAVVVRGYPREGRPDQYSGTFDLVIGKDQIQGSFTAPICDALSHGVDKPPDVDEPECK
jgi:hypothetical protein